MWVSNLTPSSMKKKIIFILYLILFDTIFPGEVPLSEEYYGSVKPGLLRNSFYLAIWSCNRKRLLGCSYFEILILVSWMFSNFISNVRLLWSFSLERFLLNLALRSTLNFSFSCHDHFYFCNFLLFSRISTCKRNLLGISGSLNGCVNCYTIPEIIKGY